MSVLLGVLFATGCANWPHRWAKLPAGWRAAPVDAVSEGDGVPIVQSTGNWGFRFGQTGSSIALNVDAKRVAVLPENGKVVQLVCSTGADHCTGLYYKTGGDRVIFLLNVSRLGLPELVTFGLQLQVGGRVAFITEPTTVSFDLDTGANRPIPITTRERLCVSAEQRVLAATEIERVSSDIRSGRINAATGSAIQAQLARYLASTARLCKQ